MTERTEALRRFPVQTTNTNLPRMPFDVPQIHSLHLYRTPARKIIDEFESLRSKDPEQFHKLLKLVREEIKRRERGKIKDMPDISLTDLRQIKKEAESLYG